MSKTKHNPGHNVVCKTISKYTNGETVESRRTSWNIVVHVPYHLDSPTMNDSETPGAITVSWVDDDNQIELHCKAPGESEFSRVNTLGLNNY
jgi:hypothetical protein